MNEVSHLFKPTFSIITELFGGLNQPYYYFSFICPIYFFVSFKKFFPEKKKFFLPHFNLLMIFQLHFHLFFNSRTSNWLKKKVSVSLLRFLICFFIIYFFSFESMRIFIKALLKSLLKNTKNAAPSKKKKKKKRILDLLFKLFLSHFSVS